MNDAEMKRWVREEIKRQITAIQFGSSAEATVNDETIEQMFPGSPGIPKRPLMSPFGFASRAIDKVIQVVGKVGADPSNRMVLGHRHSARPALEKGESTVYSTDSGGKVAYQVRAALEGLYVMSPSGKKMGVLIGDDTVAFLTKLVQTIAAHTHSTPGSIPSNVADFNKMLTDDLAKKTLISTKDGGFT